MPLTADEKEILGHMTDLGFLKGERRIAAGSDDVKAREYIAEFKDQVKMLVSDQLRIWTENKANAETQLQLWNRIAALCFTTH